MKYTAAYAAVAVAVLPVTSGSPLHSRDDAIPVEGIATLTPSPDLVWTPCYNEHGNYTCAQLEVPLDYEDPAVGTTHLAIIKKPSQNESAQDVLVNYGGPGGSSVLMVAYEAAKIEAKIGTQYNLVGIDPRGVQFSGPDSDCFSRYPQSARAAFIVESHGVADVVSDYTLKQSFQATQAYGKFCSAVYAVNGTAKYASTVATAQDMLHYIKLRAKERGTSPEDAKLWYYGISYGSFLGQTFAALWPDRVERMILDGVMDGEDAYNGGWETSPSDGDAAVQTFFQQCFEAGPELCAFHQNASSWEELEQRYIGLLEQFKEKPVGVVNVTAVTSLDSSDPELWDYSLPGVGTWKDLYWTVFQKQYQIEGYSSFPQLDIVLSSLEAGHASELGGLAQKTQFANALPYEARVARAAINCLDANGRFNASTFDEYKAYLDKMSNISKYGGLYVATLTGPICSALQLFPPKSQTFEGVPKADKTYAPILFVNMKFDPVTPLRSAKKMSSLFPGSAVLTVDNSGHTAHYQESKCASKWESQYFADASLPPPDTICEVDEPNPWIASAKLAAGENNQTQS